MSNISSAKNICEPEIEKAAKLYDIPINILYAVGLTETGYKNSLQPYALNINGKAVFAKSKAEALRELNAAKRKGIKLIDVGCMQINQYFHGEHFKSMADMFVPEKNVQYAARFLKQLYEREGSWTMAVARYHAGPNNDPAQKRYVCRVIKNMVATNFGNWTKEAKKFCEGEA